MAIIGRIARWGCPPQPGLDFRAVFGAATRDGPLFPPWRSIRPMAGSFRAAEDGPRDNELQHSHLRSSSPVVSNLRLPGKQPAANHSTRCSFTLLLEADTAATSRRVERGFAEGRQAHVTPY